MKRIETTVPDVVLLEPRVYEDDRGWFMETYRRSAFAEMGLGIEFVQHNHSRSARGTLRGLHYQLRHAQAKLCRVVRGAILDVAVDIRRGSPTFRRWVAVELSEHNRRLLYIPPGFAHGFVAQTDAAELLYQCSDYYHPEDEYGIVWDDPDLGIDWGGVAAPLLSARDRAFPRFSQIPAEHLPVYDATP